jgi:hypothetical protein
VTCLSLHANSAPAYVAEDDVQQNAQNRVKSTASNTLKDVVGTTDTSLTTAAAEAASNMELPEMSNILKGLIGATYISLTIPAAVSNMKLPGMKEGMLQEDIITEKNAS